MNKYIKLLLIVFALGIVAIVWTIFNKSLDQTVNNNKQTSSFSSCSEEYSEERATDPQMAGIIEPGAAVTLIRGFYACNPLERGDLVSFRYHQEQPPVIRVVRGIPGDRFEVIKDPKGSGWKIRINNEFIKVGKNEDLVYGSPSFVPPLGLAAKSHSNVIAEGEVILMTNSHSGKFDSTLMGLLSVKDIIGKISLRQEPAAENH